MGFKQIIYGLSIMIITLSLVGCGGSSGDGSNTNTNSSSDVETSLDISLSALYAGRESSSASAPSRADSFNKILTGELQAVNHTDGTTETYEWSVYLDENDLNVSSDKTIVLEPGDYTFSLLLNDTNRQYAATSVLEIIADGSQNTIPLSITPIIGDTIVDVSVLANLATYKLSYSASELSSLTSPQIGISVDGDAENIFSINSATGFSQTYLNLADGAHNIHLSLYDGNIQVGRSVPEQENITVVAGDPINIDMIALHGEAEFIIDVADGNATIKANISQEIIDEIGLDNLEVIMTLSDGNTTKEALMSLVTDANSTYATTTLSGMQFGTFALQLTFNDTRDTSVPVGSCLMDNVVLDTNGSTQDCQITLQRRSIVGGNLLATVGINVFNTNHEPIAGASVYANDQLIGITNEGTFGTRGYLKTFHLSGNVVFSADDSNMSGDINTTLAPLDVRNFDIILDTQVAQEVATIKDAYFDEEAKSSGLVIVDDNLYTFDGTYWLDENSTIVRYQDVQPKISITKTIYSVDEKYFSPSSFYLNAPEHLTKDTDGYSLLKVTDYIDTFPTGQFRYYATGKQIDYFTLDTLYMATRSEIAVTEGWTLESIYMDSWYTSSGYYRVTTSSNYYYRVKKDNTTYSCPELYTSINTTECIAFLPF